MGIVSKIFKFALPDTSVPRGGTIFKTHTTEMGPERRLDYSYDTIERMVEDERIVSIVSLFCAMVEESYKRIEFEPEDDFEDYELDTAEIEILKTAKLIAKKLEFRTKFHDYAWQLITHGDVFERYELKSDIVSSEIIPIPLNNVRVIEESSQAESGNSDLIMREEMIDIRGDDNPDENEVLKKEKYIHISIKNHGVWRRDKNGGDTFSIYSKPPLSVLSTQLNWKKKTIENDILWKNKTVPRVKHTLKMPAITPNRYQGTMDEKVAKAKAEAQKIVEEFITSTQNMRPDADIVTSDAVETGIVEAKSTNYQKPNEVLNQINAAINTVHGIPEGLTGGKDTSISMESAGIFAGLRVKHVSNKIATALERILKEQLLIAGTGATEENIERIVIKIDDSLTKELFDKFKIALSAKAAGVFTKQEIRQLCGYSALPLNAKDLVPAETEGAGPKEDPEGGNIMREGADANETNRSSASRQNNAGDGTGKVKDIEQQ